VTAAATASSLNWGNIIHGGAAADHFGLVVRRAAELVTRPKGVAGSQTLAPVRSLMARPPARSWKPTGGRVGGQHVDREPCRPLPAVGEEDEDLI